MSEKFRVIRLRWLRACIFLCLGLPGFHLFAGEFSAKEFTQDQLSTQEQILPVDQAFMLTAVKRSGQINLFWQIAPGYYLYRHRLKFTREQQAIQADTPAGLAKTDEFFGKVEVYYEQLEVNLPVTDDSPVNLTVEYQGCADAGICYPPEKKHFSL